MVCENRYFKPDSPDDLYQNDFLCAVMRSFFLFYFGYAGKVPSGKEVTLADERPDDDRHKISAIPGCNQTYRAQGLFLPVWLDRHLQKERLSIFYQP